MLKDLEHVNIVNYLGFEVTDNHINIFLEYIPGGSIDGMLKRRGATPINVVRVFVKQILTGLEYLHSRNILHRVSFKADIVSFNFL